MLPLFLLLTGPTAAWVPSIASLPRHHTARPVAAAPVMRTKNVRTAVDVSFGGWDRGASSDGGRLALELGAAAAAVASAPNTTALYMRANHLRQTHRYADALAIYEQLAGHTPEDGKVWIKILGVHKATGKLGRAEEAITRGIEACPSNAVLRQALADLCREQKRYREVCALGVLPPGAGVPALLLPAPAGAATTPTPTLTPIPTPTPTQTPPLPPTRHPRGPPSRRRASTSALP